MGCLFVRSPQREAEVGSGGGVLSTHVRLVQAGVEGGEMRSEYCAGCCL